MNPPEQLNIAAAWTTESGRPRPPSPGVMDRRPVSEKLEVDGPQTDEDRRVANVIDDNKLKYPSTEGDDDWDLVKDDDELAEKYFEDLKILMATRYINVANFFISENSKNSLSVVNADKLANHLNDIRKIINNIYRQYDDRPLSDAALKTEFEDVVKRVVPLINQAIEAAKAKGGSRNKSRSRKHKKSRNHKKSRKHKKSSKKSKRL
jgi:hypothetical protein